MKSEQIGQLVKLYDLALKMAWITVGTSVLAILLQSCNLFAPQSACIPFGGALPAVALITFFTGLLAVWGMRWARKQAKSLLELVDQDSEQAQIVYARVWNFQTNAGATVTTGAVIMIPLAIPSLMMGLAGAIGVFALFGGAWIHMKARKINREIAASGGSASNSQISGQVEIEKSAGIAPLFVAAILLLTNVIIEISFTNDLRGIPTFFNAQSTTNAGVSMSMGFAGAFDVLVFSVIGLTLLIYAIVIRKRMPRKRLLIITVLTVAHLLLVQGTLAPLLAKALGPSASGSNLRNQMNESSQTIDWVQTLTLPDGFEALDQNSIQEEVNSRWLVQSAPLNSASFEQTCSNIITFAVELGATNWVEKSGASKGPVSDANKTQAACIRALNGYPKLKVQRHTVTSPDFILAGQAAGGAGSPIALKLNLLKQGSEGEHPNTWIYELTVYTTYNEDALTLEGGLSKGTVEINDVLTLIAQERLAAPDRDPTDPVFVDEILNAYQHNIKIEVVQSKPGVANRLDVTNSDGAHLCLAIDPWDAEREGMEDPGYGYGLGFMDDLKSLKGFGVAVEGGCKP